MSYDGENKMTRFDALDAQTSPTHYIYDADGKRKRSSGTTTVRYIHGLEKNWGQAFDFTIL